MIDQINELPEDGLKSSPETSRYTENKWISRKNQNKLYFLHLIDILNDLLLTFHQPSGFGDSICHLRKVDNVNFSADVISC